MKLKELLEDKGLFKRLKDNKIPLTPEERAECMKKKAVWNFHMAKGGKHVLTPAVWKGKDPNTGKIIYITNTHRAYQARNSLKATINIFHKFIKGTA